jgi:hypothetical protein
VKPAFVIGDNDDSQAVPASGAVDSAGSFFAETTVSHHVDPGDTKVPHVPHVPHDHIPTPAEYYGVAHPLVVFITPNYRNELPNNAMLGELGTMRALATLRNPDGSPALEIARWIPNGPDDLEGRLIVIDPLAGTRNNDGLNDGTSQKELSVRTDIDRVVAVVVRFPVSETQFAQIQTVFCTYGRPRMVADFSNAGLYMDMRYGPSTREREKFGINATTKPYSVKVLSQFDVIRVPNEKLAAMIEQDLEGAA